MNTTELNTTDGIRMISDEDLGAVGGGFQTYNGGGASGTYRGGGKPEGTAFHDVLSIGASAMFALVIAFL